MFSPLLFVELLEELQIVLEHQTNVVDAVFQHGDTLDADAEGEAGVLVRVDVAVLQTLAFILVIAALVQMVEIILKKVSPALYQALGIFLPLITTNCAVLGVAILVIQKDYNLLESVVYAFSTALGFALALIVFAGIREQQALVRIPKGMQGVAIVMVTAALLSLAFMGFSGVDGGLKSLFGLE